MLNLFGRRGRKLRQAADAARDAGEWAQAARLYAKYLSKWPNGRKAAIWIQLGNVRKEAAQYGPARMAYQRAIALMPTDAEPYLQLGHLFKRAGAPGKSRAAYLRALHLDPTCLAARTELERSQRRDLAPADNPAAANMESRAILAAANRARDLKNWVPAASLYGKYLSLPGHAEDASIWVQLGHMQKEAGDNDRALQSYQRAIRFQPNIADTHLQLGHLQKSMGAVEKAASSYRTALQLDARLDAARRELAILGVDAEAHDGNEKLETATAKPLDGPFYYDVQFPPIYAGLSRRF